MKLGKKEIGAGHPVYLIAEMSANHAGDIVYAKEIIHAAKESGADCIKMTVDFFGAKSDIWS